MSRTKFNFFFLYLSALLVLFLQTSVWPRSFTSPQLVVPFLVFAVSYRGLIESTFSFYIFASLSSLFTATSFGTLVCTYFLLFILNVVVNDRFFKREINYFSTSCFVNTFAMGVFFSVLSPVPFYILSWTLSSIFTFFVSFPLYLYFIWLDEKTQKEDVSEGILL